MDWNSHLEISNLVCSTRILGLSLSFWGRSHLVSWGHFSIASFSQIWVMFWCLKSQSESQTPPAEKDVIGFLVSLFSFREILLVEILLGVYISCINQLASFLIRKYHNWNPGNHTVCHKWMPYSQNSRQWQDYLM